MSTNNNESAHSFASLKKTYGSPYLNDIQNQRPYLPIDQTNVNISSLGPEFFTFLVEVDLKKEKSDTLKAIRRITPEFDLWEHEVYINAGIHYTKLLDKDFFTKLDTFKILKSIQFRIEAYKAYLSKTNDKNIKKELFVKILEEDINMGIVFSVPKNEPLESFQTNIHNLLNSNIKINKIYFEIILPQSLFFQKPRSDSVPQQFVFNHNVIVNHFNQQKPTKKSADINDNLNDLIENNRKLLQNLKNSKISPRIKKGMSQMISNQLSEVNNKQQQFVEPQQNPSKIVYSQNTFNKNLRNVIQQQNRNTVMSINNKKTIEINTEDKSPVTENDCSFSLTLRTVD